MKGPKANKQNPQVGSGWSSKGNSVLKSKISFWNLYLPNTPKYRKRSVSTGHVDLVKGNFVLK